MCPSNGHGLISILFQEGNRLRPSGSLFLENRLQSIGKHPLGLSSRRLHNVPRNDGNMLRPKVSQCIECQLKGSKHFPVIGVVAVDDIPQGRQRFDCSEKLPVQPRHVRTHRDEHFRAVFDAEHMVVELEQRTLTGTGSDASHNDNRTVAAVDSDAVGEAFILGTGAASEHWPYLVVEKVRVAILMQNGQDLGHPFECG